MQNPCGNTNDRKPQYIWKEKDMADLIIRRAEEKDVLAIEHIEKQCFAVPWSYESLHKDIVENGMAFYIVAEIASEDGGEAT